MREHGLKRIAIVDWDVHHGNSTQHAFYSDPRVLFISIHQDNRYPPNSGPKEERGEGAGAGFNINVPLPPGCGGPVYAAVFDRIVEPALMAFAPELILVSCGFDAGAYDPLASQMLCGADFRRMTQCITRVAAAKCSGKAVFVHEGGYSPQHVPYLGHGVIEELYTAATGTTCPVSVEDPFAAAIVTYGGNDKVHPHQEAAIQSVCDLIDFEKLKGGA